MIDNLPESNGYQFLSMTRKFWRFSTLDQPNLRLPAHRDPPHTSSRIFPILSTFLTYCDIRTIRRHFCNVIHAYAAAQNSFIHSCMIQHEEIFYNIFLISRQIPLTKFLPPSYTVRYGDSEDFSCFSSTSTHRSQILQTTPYVPTRSQVTDLLQITAYICCNIQYKRYTTSCRKLIFLYQCASFAVAFGTILPVLELIC